VGTVLFSGDLGVRPKGAGVQETEPGIKEKERQEKGEGKGASS